jgi:hypothetical protein
VTHVYEVDHLHLVFFATIYALEFDVGRDRLICGPEVYVGLEEPDLEGDVCGQEQALNLTD